MPFSQSKEDLFKEWREIFSKTISYQRAGIDDNMTDEMYEMHENLYDRRKEIERILLSLGYEVIDGEEPYSKELKKIK